VLFALPAADRPIMDYMRRIASVLKRNGRAVHVILPHRSHYHDLSRLMALPTRQHCSSDAFVGAVKQPLNWLSHAACTAEIAASVCTGTFLLAAADVLHQHQQRRTGGV